MFDQNEKYVFDLWATEQQTPTMRLSLQTKGTLHSEQTPFQHLALVDTYAYGRVLFLDGIIQTTERDEFVYHEMITHPALNTHGNPKKALVIGGGDGGSIRELIKYPTIEKAVLCEIDARVVENARKYLPSISCALDDPKVEVRYQDGIKHVQEHKNTYDIICVDSPDPIGPAVGLYGKEFYQYVYESLTEDGIFVGQTESPLFNQKLLKRVNESVSSLFPITRVFLAFIPTYPGGMWSFTMGSKKHDPLEVLADKFPGYQTRYYSPEIHKAAFALPPFVQDIFKK